jgi:hypothetical protein
MCRIGRKVKSKYRLDWILLESYLRDDPGPAEACRIAPHFARTMSEANEALDDPDSALAADPRRRSRRTCRSLPDQLLSRKSLRRLRCPRGARQ